MQKRNATSLVIILLLSSSILILSEMETSPTTTTSASSSEAKVHIVYTEKPEEGIEPESFHINTLASVYGSEEAAKGALIYSYKHAASGFSAKLTPEQVEQLSKQPGVLQVVPSQTVQLHSGTANFKV
ncbi:hypothetical protein Leryth_017791 [Lithospermum erythrorhizon]|nr:hypothetical protein Leryth_017791 [Lithospermum erythrorhizon]